MKLKRLVYLMAVLLFAFTNPERISNTIILDLDKMEHVRFEELINKVRYVALENTDKSIISSVSKLVVTTNFILIADYDQQLIFLFDNEGKFISRIGVQGKGHQEDTELYNLIFKQNKQQMTILDPAQKQYADITDIYFDKLKRHIHVFDASQKAIITYDTKNNFISRKLIQNFDLSGPRFAKLDDKYYFSRYGAYADTNYLAIFDEDLNFERSSIKIPHILQNVSIPISECFDYYSGNLYYHPVLIDTIFKMDTNGTIKPEYKIKIITKNVTDEQRSQILERTSQKEFMTKVLPRGQYLWDINNLLLTKDHVYMSFSSGLTENISILHYSLYSKKTGKTRILYSVTPNKEKGFYFTEFTAKSGNEFVGVLTNPKASPNYTLFSNPEMFDTISKVHKLNLSENSNPVVAFYTLKPF